MGSCCAQPLLWGGWVFFFLSAKLTKEAEADACPPA